MAVEAPVTLRHLPDRPPPSVAVPLTGAEVAVGVGRVPLDWTICPPRVMPGRRVQTAGIEGDLLAGGEGRAEVQLDADRVEGDMSSWFATEPLGRLLNANLQKTSRWYLYYWYGQQNGNSARVTPPSGSFGSSVKVTISTLINSGDSQSSGPTVTPTSTGTSTWSSSDSRPARAA